ncbi:hypothetical protein PR202_ga14092 [Eleusine coracana subsp. coracana]|uniref:Ubiquitin-like protease family profile domain-containing protein n=1 Tax=Eleusine coracana subsp. coracana TaxID=191504 RepID=A0AAV5CGA8_ELECO|nr:hypothetical protein PR202_ga14092 [Eleusine coracana subsp. coracana]
MVADSEDESVPSSPNTSSTTNYDMPGYTEQNLQHIYNACDTFNELVGSALITLLAESEAENRNSGPVRVQFSLDDLQWPRKQQKIWYLETRYQEIWKDIPSNDDFEDVIYPKGDPDAVSISKRDAELLLPETFVNDTIIDFYIKYLTTRIESTEKRRYHFFNSFFFRKLADLDKEQGRAPEGRAAFLRVRKWTRKINIFEKDFLFVPVNFGLHWSLIVVCYPGEVVTLKGMNKLKYGSAKLSAKLPCILHMDSLKGSHSGLKDIIQSYLWEEWKERHPEAAADNSDKFLHLRFVSLELPQQDNSFDCGLFLLHYVELFLMDVPSNFNPLKIDVFSGFLGEDWFPPAEASHKRSVVQKLIHEVVTGSFQDHPKLACSNEQPDERHQSRSAEIEPAGEFLARSLSSGQAELVCTSRDDAHETQLNDSEQKVLSASGGMETGRVSMVGVQNLQESGVCLPENDTVVCLSSQDEKNETLVDMISCGPEDGEVLKGPSGGVSYMEHSESLCHTLDDNQKYSSQAEVKVQDILVSKCCSISYNSEEVITYQEYSLQRNTVEVGHESYMPSQGMDSLVMLDSSKVDTGPNPEMMTGEDNVSDSGHMASATQGDINKDVAELKRDDSLADHITADNATKDSVKQSDTNTDNSNHSEQYATLELREGNADNGNNNQIMEGVLTDETIINADGVDQHLPTNGAIHCEDAMEAVPCDDTICTEAQDRTVPREGDASCTDAEMPLVDRPCFIKNKTVFDNTNSHAESPLLDGICEEKDTIVSDDKCTQKDDTQGTNAKRPLLDGICEEEDTVVSDDKCTQKDDSQGTVAKRPLLDDICEEKGIIVCDDKCTKKDDSQGTVAKRPMLDGICEEKDINIIEPDDKCTQKDDSHGTVAKRPLPDSVCDEKDIVFSGDKGILKDDVQVTDTERPLPDSFCEGNVVSSERCIRKDDAHGTDAKRPLPCEKDTAVPERSMEKDAKIERHYKRRKVLSAESQKERNFSGVSSSE